MVYMILNFVLAATLIGYSFSLDSRKDDARSVNPLVNSLLFLSTLFILMGATMACVLWAPRQLATIFGRITFVICGWYSISLCTYSLTYPHYEKNVLLTVVQWVLNVFAFGYIIFNPKCITDISIHKVSSLFHVHSIALIPNSPYFSDIPFINFFYLFLFLYMIFFPFVTMLMILVRAENVKDRLESQNIRLTAFGFVSSWVMFTIIVYASQFQTMMFSLSFLCFIPETLLMIRASKTEEIWDSRFVYREILKFLLRYLAPAVLAGFIWVWSWPLFSRYPVVFVLIALITLFGVAVSWQIGANYLTALDFLRTKKYEHDFEMDLSKLDFEMEYKDVCSHLYSYFQRYVDSSSMQILVDTGTGYLETVFNTQDDNTQISVNNEAFEYLINQKHPVVFREFAEHDYSVAIIKPAILSVLEQTKSDAFIILNEGRHVLGVICLGQKVSKNVYNEYDYEVFNKLYPNFFVIGYYMKNIVNQSVVGTVNREIRMSSQIITSIQENMDLVKNDKVDVGYRMISSHNIGGEFIDMIRLTDTRHIFIIGALNTKGIAASMNMVIMKSIIRTFLAETSDFKLLVEKTNNFIRTSLPRGTYFSGTFGLMDFKTDTLYYINCGSPAIFLYNHAYNNTIEIQGEGHVLGFVKDIKNIIKVKKIKLAQGDIVLACTDGLIEAHSLRGDSFGKERVQKAIMENSTYPADKMAQFEYETLTQFTSKELEDDVTVLVIKYLGGK